MHAKKTRGDGSDSGRLLVIDRGPVIGLAIRSGIASFTQLKTELEEQR